MDNFKGPIGFETIIVRWRGRQCNCTICANRRLTEWHRKERDAFIFLVVGATIVASFIIAYHFW